MKNLIILLTILIALPAFGARPATRKAKVDLVQTIANARAAVDSYDFDRAADLMELYFDNIGSQTPAADAASLAHTAEMGQQMMDRVEDVVVVDSLVVDKDEFFKFYLLTSQAGRFKAADSRSAVSPTYVTQDGLTEFFGADNGRLASSRMLADGQTETPRVYPNFEGIDIAAYPFLMPDGLTLYFAGEGEMSLGGFDIFITRRSDVDDEFLQPQNVGMPFNSPADDYLLAIDEASGLGWWATDRNSPDDKVTIYVFIPSQLRKNLDTDLPYLANRARLTSIAATHPEGYQRVDVKSVVERADEGKPAAEPEFIFPLPGGKVLTSLDQAPNGRTREMLEEWAEGCSDLAYDRGRLEALRIRYAKGDKARADEILKLERSLDEEQQRLARLANDIIKSIKL